MVGAFGTARAQDYLQRRGRLRPQAPERRDHCGGEYDRVGQALESVEANAFCDTVQALRCAADTGATECVCRAARAEATWTCTFHRGWPSEVEAHERVQAIVPVGVSSGRTHEKPA